jgi:hypothetical protein
MRAIVTNNLVNRSGSRFPARELPLLADYLKQVYAVTDHILLVDRVWAKAVDAVIEAAEPPLLAGIYAEFNQAIVTLEGYQQIVMELEPYDHPATDLVKQGITPVSITSAFTMLACPLCDQDVWDCKHAFSEIPYFNRTGVVDAIEVSLVGAAAVREAKVIEV